MMDATLRLSSLLESNAVPHSGSGSRPVLAIFRGSKQPPRHVSCRGLKENIAKLPPINGIRRVLVPAVNHSIENKEGKKASVAIYNYLAQQHGGKLDKDAAARGIELYGEYVEEARQQPGSHPNIDLLFKVAAEGLSLDVVVEQQE